MEQTRHSVITGTGSYIPSKKVTNADFLDHEFFGGDGRKIEKPNQEIIDKFFQITTISERRYVSEDMTTSDMAYSAAKEAIESAETDKESLDYIIVAHNFGDVKENNKQVDMVPTIALRSTLTRSPG